MRVLLAIGLGCLLVSCGSDEQGPADAGAKDAAVQADAKKIDAPPPTPDAPVLPPDAAPQPDGNGRTPEEQHVYNLCQTVGVAFCKKFDMCGLEQYNDCIEGFDEEVCQHSYRVRNEDELVNMCLPWVDSLTCVQLTTPGFQLDPSCYHQFRGR